jgi:hypothetical protein
MSYNDTPHYERETFLKNRLDALLKPIVGRLSGTNAPGIKLNDNPLGAYLSHTDQILYFLCYDNF